MRYSRNLGNVRVFHEHTRLAIVGIIANFVFLHMCSFYLLSPIDVDVNVKLEIKYMRITFHWYKF